MKYRSAFDRLKRAKDGYGRPIWVEEKGHDGKPNVFYRYDSKGRLMKYTRKIFGYSVTAAEYERFGDHVTVNGEW
jgi:hypothetical protein